MAGTDSETLGKCLVAATSDADKVALVRWMFANITLHPAVADLSAVTTGQRDKANEAAAGIIERLLSVACRQETAEALRNEGAPAIRDGFQTLGQVAGAAMLSDATVRGGFAQIGKYFDEKKMNGLLDKP